MSDINQICTKYGGTVTWGFSQSSFGIWKRLLFNKYTRMGICAGLVSHWIKYHSDGSSLAAKLGGGGAGQLNEVKLNEIATLHASVSHDSDQQTVWLNQWLKMHGIFPLFANQKYPTTPFRNIEHSLTSEVRGLNDAYAKLSFGGTAFFSRAAHAVGVWGAGNGSEVLYFDPNHGEFWFPSCSSFNRFFIEYFRCKYLSKGISFNEYYKVIAYGKGG